MQFFLSLKSMPELRLRSWKERRQAFWHAGLKPYRHWRVWAALALSSLVTLWGLNTIVGNMFLHPEFLQNMLTYPELADSRKGMASVLILMLAIFIPPVVAFHHVYLKTLRPYLVRIPYDPAGSWWGAALRGLALDGLLALLLFTSVVVLDLAINSFDERPDPRIAAVLGWPEPIPDANNGFIAAVGLQAPPGTAPFEAGARWLKGIEETIARQAHDHPKAPEGLKYAAYAAKPKAGAKPVKISPAAQFCDIGSEACWKVLQEGRSEVAAWIAANQELLARYQTLQKYLQWQYTIPPDGAYTPLPSYQGMLKAQGLFLAAAMVSMDKGQVGKGLDMIGDDIHFVRNMLASKDMLIGKMIAASMLSRDLAVLAETLAERPNDLKPYWAQIEKMLDPLTASQLSTADAFRFEERLNLSTITQLDLSNPQGSEVPAWLNMWTMHHFKKNAVANQSVRYWDRVLKRTEVRDAAYAPPISSEDAATALGISRATGFMHNLTGKIFSLIAVPNYSAYPNKAYDLNALNNLVRLRLALAKSGVSAKDLPAFLDNGDKTLWNPETGKPFEWDAVRKQIYFSPATDSFKQHYSLGSGVEGRTGVAVAEVAAPQVVADAHPNCQAATAAPRSASACPDGVIAPYPPPRSP